MIAVLKESTGVSIDTMMQQIRKDIHAGQVGNPAVSLKERVESWDQITEIIERVVEDYECRNDMRWQDLEFAFGTADDVKEFLIERVMQEVTLMESPRPKKALAKVCLAIAIGGPERIELIAKNTGYPQTEVDQIATGYEDFIAYLKKRYNAAVAECQSELHEQAEEIWHSFHAAD